MHETATGRPGRNAGKACAAGFSAPGTSRPRLSCCERGRDRPFHSSWARSPRSTNGAAVAVTVRPTFACSPAGLLPVATITRRIGSRVPPSRSIRRGISYSTPTRIPNCRPVRPGPTHRRCASIRGCANTAKPRRAARCHGLKDRGQDRAFLAFSSQRNRCRSRRRATARHRSPGAAIGSGRDRFSCVRPVSRLLGEALGEQAGPDAPVERRTGDGLLHIRLEPLAADTHARITTPHGVFAGRDHLITITPI